ncbi:class I SAM-dependent methyltransferase [Kribbella qitaiheensis]|uniref:Class I SAM-dependent methyltransferase n=2 Tax=Kribbella qitaiheensis TaxID=1544730 RepID=A0A7G6X903_9ACTN|nr:class I SAM-dependent methyltransferase [Kribbella qitaiheensis]
MDAEFDVVADWTRAAVEQLGADHAIPAGCRGSASPSALAWLAEALEFTAGTRLLDLGAGIGGPAAWAVRRYGVRPVLADPMEGACRAAARLFGLPAFEADGTAVPLRTASISTAWCLGVLCTVEDKAGLLAELHRVLAPGAGLGLLVLVAQTTHLDPIPAGNSFPTQTELQDLLSQSGFTIEEQVADPRDTPSSWTRRTDRVDALIRRQHHDDKAYLQAEEQEDRLGVLLSSGQLSSQLLHATRSSRAWS